MRISLPVTLFASLILHVGVGAAFALSWIHGASMSVTLDSQADAPPTTMLLRSEETPAATLPRTASAQPVSALPLAKSPLPVAPTSPVVATVLPPASPPPALALEANPNAHLRPMAPDAVLNPNPPPLLSSAGATVFILDVSGSMYEPYAGSTRIALARENLSRQILSLKNGTPFAVTLYALSAYRSGPLVAASDATREAAVRFIGHDVDCGGGTNLPAGLAAAQELHPGAIVLVTDGDLNEPAYVLADKTRDIFGSAGHCPALAIIGVAPRASQRADRLLQGLAEQQGGTYVAAQLRADADLITSAASVTKPASATP